MILNYLSIPELNFSKSWRDGWLKIKNSNNFDKYMTLFWFLGPFIYLIERDPADLWLTIICVIFLARCIKKKEWKWLSQLWFKSALALWLLGIFSAITGPDPFFTLQQGFVWIRFPLYAAAAQVWLAKDRDIRIIMLVLMILGLLIMSAILIAEMIIEPKVRLTWPYGDLVPGGYIAKLSLPIFCVMVAITVSRVNKSSLFSGLIAFISLTACALTGERINVLIKLCSSILASLFWKPRFILFFILIVINILIIFAIVLIKPNLANRFGTHFIKNIPIINMLDSNEHWGAWRGGIHQGLETPLKGIGPSGTRKNCAKLDPNFPTWLPGKNHCLNHPHNFYIQLFAETGIVGLIVGSIMFMSIIRSCYRARTINTKCPMSATAFVIPLAFFFPLQQFGSFYGQWGNLFIWFAIGFALSQFQCWEKINKNS